MWRGTGGGGSPGEKWAGESAGGVREAREEGA